ncbi:MAG: hypothetical protein JWQ09_42 [Segetibacter sp.]|nr:hypothetical protein [Segetibacter sp.]
MKRVYITTILLTLTGIISNAQMTGQLIQGTIKASTGVTDAAIAVIRSSATFNGKFSNVQFTFQIPTSVSPQPTVTIKSNPLNNYIPTANYLTQVTTEDGYYNYLFAALPPDVSPVYNFVATTEIEALEVQVHGLNGQVIPIRLASLANGGSTGQLNFYIEISGNNNTNVTSMFYGAGAVNGGSYSAYSYVPLSPSLVPLKLVSFSVIKSSDNAILKWSVENQSPTNSHFEIERSTNGSLFKQFGRSNIVHNGMTANTYTYTDQNISTIKNNGLIYYRIKQLDKDGQYIYSEIKTVRLYGQAIGANVYPNPVKDVATITFDIGRKASVTISVLNTEGKEIQKYEMAGLQGINTKNINIGMFSSGTYLIKIKAGNETAILPFVKAQK